MVLGVASTALVGTLPVIVVAGVTTKYAKAMLPGRPLGRTKVRARRRARKGRRYPYGTSPL